MAIADYTSNRPFLGASQVGISYARNEEDVQKLTKDMLARELNTGRVVGFVGSGVSLAYSYRSWQGFADEIVFETLEAFRGKREILAEDSETLLRSFRHKNRAGADSAALRFEITPGDHTLIVLEECRSCFERANRLPTLRSYIETWFHPDVGKIGKLDPLEKLIRDLGIRRFVTTNYDLEIERAFHRVLDSPQKPLGLSARKEVDHELPVSPEMIGPLARSLSVNPAETEALVQFAIGAPGYERGVFHCHGRSTEPEAAIVTERDYQRIYLHPDPRHVAYREAFELVFSANPVLFLGLGMQESDILRPLRQFVSERRSTPNERPIFALMEQPPERVEEVKLRKYLYTRYGVKVIFYPFPTSSAPRVRTASFCAAIDELAGWQQSWWQDWQRIPPIRTPTFQTDGAVRTHHREVGPQQAFDSAQNDQRLTDQIEDLEKRHLVVVLGRAGAGKGSLGLRLVDEALPVLRSKFKKRFFATTRFTNEFLSVIESAADFFLGRNEATSEAPLQRLAKALQAPGNLLVVGGIERLLVEQLMDLPEQLPGGERLPNQDWPAAVAGTPPSSSRPINSGDPITPEIRDFLTVLKDPKTKATVVLTSSLLPSTLGVDEQHVLTIPGIGEDVVVRQFVDHLGESCRSIAAGLFHDLEGHAYALAIILAQVQDIIDDRASTERFAAPSRWLRRLRARLTSTEASGRLAFTDPAAAARRWLERLRTRLTSIEASRRPVFVVSAAVDLVSASCLDEQERKGLLAILHRVALFTTPITLDVICQSMSPISETDADRSSLLDRLEKGVELLSDLKLLCRISNSRLLGKPRYTAHTLVRAHVLHLIGAEPKALGEPQRFVLPGYTNEAEEAQPVSEEAHRLTTSSVDALLGHLEVAVAEDQQSLVIAEIRSRARAVFGMMRSRWNALALSALSSFPREASGRSHYDSYQHRLLRLTNSLLAAAIQTDSTWCSFEAASRERIESAENGILYADELSWLYNEMGLVAFCKGLLHDSFALWTVGSEINRAIERGYRGSRWLQSSLNIAAVQIERGNLQRAKAQIELILSTAIERQSLRHLGRAWGYLGWVHHLGADFKRAEEYYSYALEILEHERVYRGASIFYRLRADLKRWLGRLPEAKTDLQNSLAAAELGRHFDLANFTRVSQTFLDMANKQHPTASAIDRVVAFSRRMGIPKLEADCCKVLGEISLSGGDVHRAGRFARRSLALSCRHGMKLRLTSILGLLGRVEMESRNRSGAISLFEAAVYLGRSQGYQLQVEGLERHLRDLEGRNETR